MDLAAIIILLRLVLMANTRSDSTATDSSNILSSYSHFFTDNLTINAVKSYGQAGSNELISV